MYKLIASDMDDTLLDPKGMLTSRTMDAIKRAMNAGAYMVLASGRMLESVRPFAEKIGVNAPVVIYNGAMVYDLAAEKTISAATIPMDTARAICRMAEDEGIYVQVYPGKGYFARERTAYTDYYEASIKVPCTITGRPVDGDIDSDVIKLLFIGEKEDTQARIDKFSRAFPDVSFMMSRPNYIEIVAKNVDKSFALKAAADALGVKPNEVVAFGDGQNDVSMLNFAGAGYCMLNASEGVRAKCSRFAPANSEDGCAKVIEQLLDRGELGRA